METSTSIFDYVVDKNDVSTWHDIWGNPIKRGAPLVTIQTVNGVPQHVARVAIKDPWRKYKKTGQTDLVLQRPPAFLNRVVNQTTQNKKIYENNRPFLGDMYKHVLKKGCDNPNCQYHRNGKLVFELYPNLLTLPELQRNEIGVRMFEWNHLDPKNKARNVADLRANVLSSRSDDGRKKWMRELCKEISKCELLCSNCHRIKTNIEGHYADGKNKLIETYEDYCNLHDIPRDHLYHQWTKLWS
jgi:hypothetical protein